MSESDGKKVAELRQEKKLALEKCEKDIAELETKVMSRPNHLQTVFITSK